MKAKTYFFSAAKHAHDIELYRNRLYNTMADMESGAIPMDTKRFDRIWNMYHGPLEELYEMMFSSRDGIAIQLTGPQIALAKKIVAWAHKDRAAKCIAAGKFQYLQYC